MIRLTYQRMPPVLRSKAARTARATAEKFFSMPSKTRAQQRFTFDDELLRSPELQEALWALSSGKCAYCESLLGAERPLVADQFRPPLAAMDLKGEVSIDHYWWLAYEWDNLLPSCAECSRSKGSRFPVEAKRAQPPARGEELARERPLVLDPRLDEPQPHLVFLERGYPLRSSDL